MRVSLILLGVQVSVAAFSLTRSAEADEAPSVAVQARAPAPLGGDPMLQPELGQSLGGLPRLQLTAPEFAPAGYQQKAGDSIALSLNTAHGETPHQTKASLA
jgi:hypothetical protein